MGLYSQGVLDEHYDTLSMLDVRDAEATRASDKEMILSKVMDIDLFNKRLQNLIFGTQGLFSQWVDGEERSGQIGRIVMRASSSKWQKHRSIMSMFASIRKPIPLSDSDEDTEDWGPRFVSSESSEQSSSEESDAFS